MLRGTYRVQKWQKAGPANSPNLNPWLKSGEYWSSVKKKTIDQEVTALIEVTCLLYKSMWLYTRGTPLWGSILSYVGVHNYLSQKASKSCADQCSYKSFWGHVNHYKIQWTGILPFRVLLSLKGSDRVPKDYFCFQSTASSGLSYG